MQGVVSRVKITGDFFLHPEDAIAELEKALMSISIVSPETEIIRKLADSMKENNAQLIGASIEDFARIFKKAVA